MASYAVVDDEVLASRYDLPLIREQETAGYDFWLTCRDDVVALDQNIDATLKPLSIDFSKGKYAYRLQQSKSNREPLARACGLTKGKRPAIIDATAGLGQDGLLLAAMGAEVTLIEQHSLIHALLDNALQRAKTGPAWLQEILQRVRLLHENSVAWLSQHESEVVYLDPMYPSHGHDKSAKVKKGMQLLRLLPDTDTDHPALFNAAQASSQSRLVVKRPNWADTLTDLKPQNCYQTKTHHYDIYLQ